MTINYQGARTWKLLEAAAGASDDFILPDNARAVSVTVHPGSGGTATLAVTCSPAPDVDGGSAIWVDVDIAGVTDQSSDAGTDLEPSVTAIRLSAATATATARVAVLV